MFSQFFNHARRQIGNLVVPTTAKLFSTLSKVETTPDKLPNIILYFWPPHPPQIFHHLQNKPIINMFFNKPIPARLSGGHTGHISMQANLSADINAYISVWPGQHSGMLFDSPHDFEPIILSKTLETDIQSEGGVSPGIKKIYITEYQKEALIVAINKLKEEEKKDPSIREEWAYTNNCATYIGKILYEIGVIQQKPKFIMTPKYVFYIADKIEQEQYSKDANTPSSMP